MLSLKDKPLGCVLGFQNSLLECPPEVPSPASADRLPECPAELPSPGAAFESMPLNEYSKALAFSLKKKAFAFGIFID
jgi:hypothetical protein